jgi:phosphoglucosamine mutase
VGRLFGTDGIRGKANHYPMDGHTALSVGQALTLILRRRISRPRIILGRDTRISGPMLESALVSGIASMGGDPCPVGVLPTPGIAFMVRDARADAGIVISASHNPYQDNGIKIFSGEGFKLSDEEENALEEILLNGGQGHPDRLPEEIGQPQTVGNAEGRYAAFLKSSFPGSLTMAGIRIVLDTANGATHRVAPEVFGDLGARVEVIHNRPDGVNINDRCGSQFTQDLERRVVESKAALGLAFDGDGDRLIAVDERGKRLSGDQVLLICALVLKDLGRLENDLVVSTVMSNLGLTVACRKYGFRHHASKVGDRYVLEDMRSLGGVIGGEESGHMIFLDYHTTGDGILAGLQLIASMIRRESPLSDLAGIMEICPQKLINVKVERKPEISTVSEVMEAIRTVERELGDEGRVLVRYSGTENLCRVMVEGPAEETTDRCCRQIAEAVRLALG